MKSKMRNYRFKIKFCLVFVSLATVFSCADLEEDPSEVLLAPTALNSEAALSALNTGMYNRLVNGSTGVARTSFHIAAFGGDDITTHSGSNKIGFRESDWRRQTPNSSFNTTYRACYGVITIANTAIDARDNIEGNQQTIDRLIGEAFFMRAFCYLTLTRTYGRVPIQIESNSNAQLSRGSFEEIYAQIESDFQQAELLLPDVYPNVPAVGARPSKGAASAMLSRLYMHWAGFPLNDTSRYAMAASKAKEVIDNAALYGYALSPDFRSMFTVGGRFAHDEGVFTMVFCNTCDRRAPNRLTGRLGLTAEAGGWEETFGEIAFFEDFESAATEDGTLQRFNDTYILEQIPRGSNPIGAEWRNFADPHPIFRKIVGDFDEGVLNTTTSDMNYYFMRYAEVLLNYAEASGRSGNVTADAWAALNAVRSRAGATVDLTAADGAIEELAFTERKWEFAGEFLRWYDLVRMDRVVEAFANRSPDEIVDTANSTTPATDGEFLYFNPIPQSELDVAPQLNN